MEILFTLIYIAMAWKNTMLFYLPFLNETWNGFCYCGSFTGLRPGSAAGSITDSLDSGRPLSAYISDMPTLQESSSQGKAHRHLFVCFHIDLSD